MRRTSLRFWAFILFICSISWGSLSAEEQSEVTGINDLQDQGYVSSYYNYPTFKNSREFFRDFWQMTKLINKLNKSGYKLDSSFRETVCLSVTYANNCGP